MSTDYKIHRWDVVMSGSSNVQQPMIYVEPDMAFLEFARDNNYAVVCNVKDTGTIYDGKQIPGVVSRSADVPSCRPNFFEETGLYVLRLWSNWYGYPLPGKLGSVSFSGLKGGTNLEQVHSKGDTKDVLKPGLFNKHALVKPVGKEPSTPRLGRGPVRSAPPSQSSWWVPILIILGPLALAAVLIFIYSKFRKPTRVETAV